MQEPNVESSKHAIVCFLRISADCYKVKQALNNYKPKGAGIVRWLFWLGCTATTTFALLPPDYLPAHDPPFSLWDKSLHATAFVVLCLIGSWAYLNRSYSLILGLIMLGGAIQLARFATGWRHMDFGDFVANAVGIMIGRIAFHILRKRKPNLN